MKRILKRFFTVENKKNKKITWKKNQENLFYCFSLTWSKNKSWNFTLEMFSTDKIFFTLEKIRQIFRNFTWNYLKKIPSKISERFFRRNVQFSPFHTWNKIFWMFLWSVSHRHTKKTYKFSPIFFPLTWRKKKYLHFCCHSKLFSWKKKKKKFHSVSHSRKQNSPENVFILDFTNGGIKFSHTWKKKNPQKILLIVFFYSVSHIKKFPWKQFQVEKTSKSEILENYTQD